MRWVAFLLVLTNLVVFLFAQRLPQTGAPEPPPPNLPRVSVIQLLGEPEAEGQRRAGAAESDCLALTGFIRADGARDWARVRGVPGSRYRIEPSGTRLRPVFRVVSRQSAPRGHLKPLLHTTLRMGLDAYLIEDEGGVRVQAGLSHSLLQARRIQKQVDSLSEQFALERGQQHLYSFALVAEDQRLAELLKQEKGRTGSVLEVVRCEAIANQRQNP